MLVARPIHTNDLPASDDLDALVTADEVAPVHQVAEPALIVENCPKCRGSGQFRGYTGRVLGVCLACKGSGKKHFKQTAAKRAQSRAAAADRKERAARSAFDAWAEANPAEAAWIKANPTFDFAKAMRDAVVKFGDLTDRQMAAVQRCIAKEAERVAARVAAETRAQEVDASRIQQAFAHARESGLIKLKLRLDTFAFTPARNVPGAINVKEDGVYLGRVVDGKFRPRTECTPEQQARIVLVCSDPAGAAKLYGQKTGRCSCCGLGLTNAESIARSIGPICAGKWGF